MDDLLTVLNGDCREMLKSLPDESVHCVVTSPPYWGLRDYKLEPLVWGGEVSCEHDWEEFIQSAANGITHDRGMSADTISDTSATRRIRKSDYCECGAWRGSYGLEPTIDLYVEHTLEIFREVRRVLRSDGTLWLNLGDSYASSGGEGLQGTRGQRFGRRHTQERLLLKNRQAGLKPKDLVGMPWRIAFALQADGWWLRSDIIWAKPNPMPESVTDRPTRSHEYVFLMTKSAKYFYDAEAIKESATVSTLARLSQNIEAQVGSTRANGGAKTNGNMKAVRSKADSFRREGSKREQAIPGQTVGTHRPDRRESEYDLMTRNKRSVWTVGTEPYSEAHFATFPTKLIEPCILAGCPVGGTVLDPFGGSGTVGKVALGLGRRAILIELSPEYVKLIQKRCEVTYGLGLTTGAKL